MTRHFVAPCCLAVLVMAVVSTTGFAQQQDAVVSAGKTVGFEYTLSLSDGTVVESNVGGDPFTYTQGQGEILPALELALAGLAIDDTKKVTLAPADAYGEVNEAAFQEVPVDQLPEEARVVDTILGAEGYDGPIRVHEVNDEFVILDFNNPLAGKTLTFDVRIVSVN